MRPGMLHLLHDPRRSQYTPIKFVRNLVYINYLQKLNHSLKEYFFAIHNATAS